MTTITTDGVLVVDPPEDTTELIRTLEAWGNAPSKSGDVLVPSLLLRAAAALKARERQIVPHTVYRPCERHKHLPVTLTTVAVAAVPVCPHCPAGALVVDPGLRELTADDCPSCHQRLPQHHPNCTRGVKVASEAKITGLLTSGSEGATLLLGDENPAHVGRAWLHANVPTGVDPVGGYLVTDAAGRRTWRPPWREGMPEVQRHRMGAAPRRER